MGLGAEAVYYGGSARPPPLGDKNKSGDLGTRGGVSREPTNFLLGARAGIGGGVRDPYLASHLTVSDPGSQTSRENRH